MLLVQQRLDRQAALFEQQEQLQMRQTRRRGRLGVVLRVRLNVDIWFRAVVPVLPRFGSMRSAQWPLSAGRHCGAAAVGVDGDRSAIAVAAPC